jgi:polysaccharide chain length determinant protein (PEP-CTERM system associated)
MAAPQNYLNVSRRALDVEDYIDMLRRYRSWIMGPVYAGLVISVVVGFLWPDTYVSYALMRINPQTVAAQLVPSTVNMQMAQRIEGLNADLRSRSNLAQIIQDQKFHLYPKLLKTAPLEDAIDQMQKDVVIAPVGDIPGDRRYATAFRIQFSYSDSHMAQKVVTELVRQLTNQNLRVQKGSADNTTEFMQQEVTATKEKLDKLQNEITAFRAAHQGSLPENGGANGIVLANLQARIGQADDRLGQMEQQKNSLQTSLGNLKQNRAFLSQSDEATPASQTVKSQNLISLDNQIRLYEMNLTAAREQYTDQHPVVTTLQAQIKVLRDEREREQAKLDAELSAAQAPADTKKGLTLPQKAALRNIDGDVASVTTQISNVDLTIKSIKEERLALEKDIRDVQAKIMSSPLVEQEASQRQQELALTKERYEDLKKRQEMAQTTQNLEKSGYGETLDQLDQATLPQSPAQPNRWGIAAGGIGLGLLVGLALAGAKEAKDTSLKNLKDVRAYTNLPVLSSIPLLENGLLVRRKRRLFWLAWSSAVMVGVAAMAAALYYYITQRGVGV